ncbi:MAG: bifunctional 3-deoxy-7-phosphoheptulonate synthase/chorismate mutase [Myxococcales bacterium]|jgi:3-deoxy-7-phosphoheptulonate synthase/chorismate mutase|nr:bifunctional 3-deoxy-7-phosphoheptulonate synthase/chorismate mutase [Myxococcales bacterium]
MSTDRLADLRAEISDLNQRLLDLVAQRIAKVGEVRALKAELGLPMFDPMREARMFEELVLRHAGGPLSEAEIRAIFRPIFEISLAHMEGRASGELRVSRLPGEPDRQIAIGDARLGGAIPPTIIAGPCAVESEEQIEAVARAVAALGFEFLRGGAFKPRTNPDSFQGLGIEGLHLLRAAADRHGLRVVSEVTGPRELEAMGGLVDLFQVGARNMANYELLKELGAARQPVLLKRSFAATLDEFLLAAEYLAKFGARDIALCERGIRTFERETRFTLDIAAVPLLKQKTALPLIVDVSHAAGRRDLVLPLAKAALAAGADGLMIEVHPFPEAALSDAAHQLSIEAFARFVEEMRATLSIRDDARFP